MCADRCSSAGCAACVFQVGAEVGGPCKSECEQFSKSCPGLAMSCQAFENAPNCWLSKTPYVYGHAGATPNHAALQHSQTMLALVLALAVAALLAR